MNDREKLQFIANDLLPHLQKWVVSATKHLDNAKERAHTYPVLIDVLNVCQQLMHVKNMVSIIEHITKDSESEIDIESLESEVYKEC